MAEWDMYEHKERFQKLLMAAERRSDDEIYNAESKNLQRLGSQLKIAGEQISKGLTIEYALLKRQPLRLPTLQIKANYEEGPLKASQPVIFKIKNLWHNERERTDVFMFEDDDRIETIEYPSSNSGWRTDYPDPCRMWDGKGPAGWMLEHIADSFRKQLS